MIGNAVKVMRIATGEEEEALPERSAAAEMGAQGGKARAAILSKKRTSMNGTGRTDGCGPFRFRGIR